MKRQTLTISLIILGLCVFGISASAQNTQDFFKVNYFANNGVAGAPDATVRLDNPGSPSIESPSTASVTTGDINICAMIYVFDNDQQLSECCGCLLTPDGLPAALTWWVGGLYGQDLVADQLSLASTLPNLLIDPAAPASAAVGLLAAPAGVSTYLVSDPELVGTAVEDLEPALARATRQAWQTASRNAEANRQTLVAACQTWVAIRRPGEALSHLLKLAASVAEESPAAMLVAWEAFTAVCISLAPLPEVDLADMGAPDALRRAIPEFLDWADSALPPTGETQPPFVAAFHDLLVRYSQLEPEDLPKLLAETRQLWTEVGRPAAAAGLAQAFAGPAAEPKIEKPKKRRY